MQIKIPIYHYRKYKSKYPGSLLGYKLTPAERVLKKFKKTKNKKILINYLNRTKDLSILYNKKIRRRLFTKKAISCLSNYFFSEPKTVRNLMELKNQLNLNLNLNLNLQFPDEIKWELLFKKIFTYKDIDIETKLEILFGHIVLLSCLNNKSVYKVIKSILRLKRGYPKLLTDSKIAEEIKKLYFDIYEKCKEAKKILEKKGSSTSEQELEKVFKPLPFEFRDGGRMDGMLIKYNRDFLYHPDYSQKHEEYLSLSYHPASVCAIGILQKLFQISAKTLKKILYNRK